MMFLTVVAPLVWACHAVCGLPEGVLFQFSHPWEGFTCWDIIMPMFIFMCGAAIPFALERRLERNGGKPDAAYWKHVICRVAMLWALGLLVQGHLTSLDALEIRPYNNTLQTIAFGYLVCAAAVCVPSMTFRIALPVACFIVYGVLLHAFVSVTAQAMGWCVLLLAALYVLTAIWKFAEMLTPGFPHLLGTAKYQPLIVALVVVAEIITVLAVRRGYEIPEMFIDTTPGTPKLYRKDALAKVFTIGYDVAEHVMYGTDCRVTRYNVDWSADWQRTDDALLAEFGLGADTLDDYYRCGLQRYLFGGDNTKRTIPTPDGRNGNLKAGGKNG